MIKKIDDATREILDSLRVCEMDSEISEMINRYKGRSLSSLMREIDDARRISRGEKP